MKALLAALLALAYGMALFALCYGATYEVRFQLANYRFSQTCYARGAMLFESASWPGLVCDKDGEKEVKGPVHWPYTLPGGTPF